MSKNIQPQSLPLRAGLVFGSCAMTHPVVLIGCHSCELGLREDKGLEVFLGIAGTVLARVHEDHVETGLITVHGVENDLRAGAAECRGGAGAATLSGPKTFFTLFLPTVHL